jgi:NADH dehydrogenase
MATQAFKNILAKMNGGEMKPYRYHDHGSLVSLAASPPWAA